MSFAKWANGEHDAFTSQLIQELNVTLPIDAVMRYREKKSQEIFEVRLQDLFPWRIVLGRLALVVVISHVCILNG